MNNRFISWRRVSTFKQGRSGLGLAAQKDIIKYFVERDKGTLIADYEECYTGKELGGCKELRKAMEHAKREHATLIIAKTDRFRNTAEALQIYEEMGDGNMVFCDLPHTDKFTLTLFWAIAEREALIISIRTKQALKALKERGDVKLGRANETYKANYNKKTNMEKRREGQRKGLTKNARHLESKEMQAFIKVLKSVFPEATAPEDMMQWNWKGINTKKDNRDKVLKLMIDYKALDNTLFRNFKFQELDDKQFQMKLASHIANLRRSVKTREFLTNIFNNNTNGQDND